MLVEKINIFTNVIFYAFCVYKVYKKFPILYYWRFIESNTRKNPYMCLTFLQSRTYYKVL